VSNALALEKSPYLLQHAENPVAWLPWGEAAFAKARAEEKPIFLSIGYATCHWCHVMAHESFEDLETARLMNELFVNIKVDREERPDVDRTYMAYIQAATGSGGWPLNVFLTPDLQPFYGGTYFPPVAKHGRPSFLELLKRIVELWTTRRADIADSAAGLTEKMRELSAYDPDNAFPTGARELHGGGQSLLGEYDPENGGFGGAPKFPRPSQPLFLLRYGRRFDDADAIKAVLHTCDRMSSGGMYDHIAGPTARFYVKTSP
jgi:uncharacterized protein YyaL (SSP411 family)